jgi:diphthamide synthase subunit DPH2
MYVFVDIAIDLQHLAQTIEANFPSERLALVSTIQFATTLNSLPKSSSIIPQARAT